MFDPKKQTEDIIESFWTFKFELSVIDFVKEVHHQNTAANFSCANLQLSLKTMTHSSSELQSAVALLDQVCTFFSFKNKAMKVVRSEDILFSNVTFQCKSDEFAHWKNFGSHC